MFKYAIYLFILFTSRDNKQVSDPLFREHQICKGNKKKIWKKKAAALEVAQRKKVYPYQQEVERFISKWCTVKLTQQNLETFLFFSCSTFNLDEICESFVVSDILQINVSYLHIYQTSLYILMLCYFILSSFRLNRPSGMQIRQVISN